MSVAEPELWEAFSHQHSAHEEANSGQAETIMSTSSEVNVPDVTPVRENVIDEDFATLTSLATAKGFSLRDVPRDGNCLFSAMLLQLQNIGVQPGQGTLRQQLVSYLEDHPYAHDGVTHLREFIAAPFVGHNPHGADTEIPTEEDLFINSISNTTTQMQLRWCRYLEKMASVAWGDHVALQGLADMLRVDVHVLSTINPDMEPIKSHHTAIGAVYLGLIGQFHYMALEKINCQQPNQVNSVDSQHPGPQVRITPEDNQERVEDEKAFNHQTQLRGLPYESSMQRENVDANTDGVFSVAPSEGQKPLAILSDVHFEEMCNPTKYPCGNFGLLENREKKLTVWPYNQK